MVALCKCFKITNMKLNRLELKSVPFSDLKKQELPAFGEEIIKTAEKYDPVELDITVGYNRLLALLPTFKLISQPYGAHPITPLLTPEREKCMLYARYIVSKMGFLMKENKYQLTPEMIESNLVVNRYLHRLDRVSRESQVYKQIGDFFIEIDSNAVVAGFFQEKSLITDCNNLKLAYTDVKSSLMKREGSIAARPNLTTKELSDPIVEALKYFFKEVEVAAGKCVFASLEPEGESNLEMLPKYELLINHLNGDITKLRNSVNLRRLTNKRKAEEHEKEGLNSNVAEQVVPPTTMVRSMNVVKAPDNTSDNDLYEQLDAEQLDEKKTVASSSKQMQLPASSKNEEG